MPALSNAPNQLIKKLLQPKYRTLFHPKPAHPSIIPKSPRFSLYKTPRGIIIQPTGNHKNHHIRIITIFMRRKIHLAGPANLPIMIQKSLFRNSQLPTSRHQRIIFFSHAKIIPKSSLPKQAQAIEKLP